MTKYKSIGVRLVVRKKVIDAFPHLKRYMEEGRVPSITINWNREVIADPVELVAPNGIFRLEQLYEDVLKIDKCGETSS